MKFRSSGSKIYALPARPLGRSCRFCLHCPAILIESEGAAAAVSVKCSGRKCRAISSGRASGHGIDQITRCHLPGEGDRRTGDEAIIKSRTHGAERRCARIRRRLERETACLPKRNLNGVSVISVRRPIMVPRALRGVFFLLSRDGNFPPGISNMHLVARLRPPSLMGEPPGNGTQLAEINPLSTELTRVNSPVNAIRVSAAPRRRLTGD